MKKKLFKNTEITQDGWYEVAHVCNASSERRFVYIRFIFNLRVFVVDLSGVDKSKSKKLTDETYKNHLFRCV
jgi:hypothetical protein